MTAGDNDAHFRRYHAIGQMLFITAINIFMLTKVDTIPISLLIATVNAAMAAIFFIRPAAGLIKVSHACGFAAGAMLWLSKPFMGGSYESLVIALCTLCVAVTLFIGLLFSNRS